MALTLAQIGSAAGNGNFVMQVKAALQVAINAAVAEAASTTDHVVRLKFAQLANKNLDNYALLMASPVAANLQATASDLNTVTDTNVQTAVNTVFTPFAFSVILPS